MNSHQEVKTQLLQEKIKDLQRQICERTRNYLAHKGMASLKITKKQQQYVQTDFQDHDNHSQIHDTNSMSTLLQQSPAQQTPDQNRNIYDDTLNRRLEISQFSEDDLNQEKKIQKKKLCNILQKLADEQKRMEIDRDDNQSIAESTHSQQNFGEEKGKYDKQLKKLKKEIKKLKKHLQFQRKVSEYAKQGLLISEEENYQFRLKIKQLAKTNIPYQKIQKSLQQKNMNHEQMVENQLSTTKDQIYKIQQNLKQQIQMKDQYANKYIQVHKQLQFFKKQNAKLIQQITKIKKISFCKQKLMILESQQKQLPFISETEEQLQTLSPQSSIRTSQKFIQALKDTSYSISNCIPITQDNNQVNLFKPQNQEEIIGALKRVEEYCKDLEKWQKHRLQSIAEQKKLFLHFIQKISEHIDRGTKQKLTVELHKLQEMKHYIRIFGERQKKTEQQSIRNIYLHSKQIDQTSI